MGEQFNFRLDPELKKAFIDKARIEGTTATELLTGFVKDYLGLEDSPPMQLDSDIARQLASLEKRIADIEARLPEVEEIELGKLQELTA
jgi:hypothetical protein